MVAWNVLAVSNAFLAVRVDEALIPSFLFLSSLLLFSLSYLHSFLPRPLNFLLSSPLALSRTLSNGGRVYDDGTGESSPGVRKECDDGPGEVGESSKGEVGFAAASLDCSEVSRLSEMDCLLPPSPLLSLTRSVSFQFPPSVNVLSATKWFSEWIPINDSESQTLALATALHVFYQGSSLYGGFRIGDSAVVVLWRSLEPLMVTMIHAKQVGGLEVLHAVMLLYLLVRWDTPTPVHLYDWLQQRGLIILGSAAWTYRNHLLQQHWRSGKASRHFFFRMATYCLTLTTVLWVAPSLSSHGPPFAPLSPQHLCY